MGLFSKTLVVAGSLAIASTASAATIDSFNVPEGYTVSSSDTHSGLNPDEVIGGVRHISILQTGGAGILRARVNLFQAGEASLNSGTGVLGNFAFAYGSLVPGGVGLDSDLSGAAGFGIKFTAADHGASAKITVADMDSTADATVPIPAGASLTQVPFSMFSGIDFHDVDGLKFEIIGVDSYDARIDSITTVPLPAGVYSGAALLAGLFARRVRGDGRRRIASK